MGRPLTAVMCVVFISANAVSAAADPDPPPIPTPGEAAACEQAWLPPTDPRVNMRYGLGALAYTGWVHAQCAGPDARFPNGAVVAGSGMEPDVPAWQRLPPAGQPPTPAPGTEWPGE